MSNRILSEPRKLSNNELVQLEKAKSKWYPAIVQTYNTSLLDMMASPIQPLFLQAQTHLEGAEGIPVVIKGDHEGLISRLGFCARVNRSRILDEV